MLLLPLAAYPQVVAERGADQITASEARALLAALDPDTRAKLLADPNGLQNLLRDTLLQRAIMQQAHAQHWDTRPDIAAAAARAHDAAIAQTFLAAQAVPPPGYPTEADIQAAYDRNRAQLMQPRTYHLLQLSIGATGAAQDAARRALADLRAQLLRARAPFDAAAARRAAGAQFADLGFVPENRLQPAARTAVSGLLEGQLSEPVCTAGGCTLLKLVATRPAGPAPLEQVRAGLARLLRAQKQRELEQRYAETFLQASPVRINEIELSHLTAP